MTPTEFNDNGVVASASLINRPADDPIRRGTPLPSHRSANHSRPRCLTVIRADSRIAHIASRTKIFHRRVIFQHRKPARCPLRRLVRRCFWPNNAYSGLFLRGESKLPVAGERDAFAGRGGHLPMRPLIEECFFDPRKRGGD